MLRQRSRSNAHPGENLKLRQSYAQAHRICELGYWFDLHFDSRPSAETHHIATRRHDVVSNLLRVSAPAHRWLEEWKADGRIVALYIKYTKCELDPDEFHIASGILLPGYILMQEAKIRHAWVKPLAEELKRKYP